MVTEARLLELMELAIAESAKSKPEDEGPHPKVGAVLTDRDGNILQTAHRGEKGKGDHAEFICLTKAEEAGQAIDDCMFFVTMEPCTARGEGKTPCAMRIINSRVRKVFIGMLDPNPVICGHGETRLGYDVEVERFPSELVRRIKELNSDFIQLYRNSHLLSESSIYVRLQIPDLIREYIAGHNGPILEDLPVGWDVTASDLVVFCDAALSDKQRGELDLPRLIQEARGYAFDKKYADRSYKTDSRGLGDHWEREVRSILASLGAGDYNRRHVLVVGIGNGLEGQELYAGCHDLIAVDIGPRSLELAKNRTPGRRFLLSAAERLTEVPTGSVDIYISLRTYSSSYFDRNAAVLEAYRVVRRGGIVLISVPNGFLDEGALIPGLLIPGTNVVDRNGAFMLAEQIRGKLALLRFEQIGVRTSIDEIFVYGRRSR